MSCIALTGSITLFLSDDSLQRILLPLVALAAGSLVGGALFHMIPSALLSLDSHRSVVVWIAFGFVSVLILEQILNWHHCHRSPEQHDPVSGSMGSLILFADGLHNLIGGLSIGAIFMADVRLGFAAWIAAALHEVPQELGDFGVLLHSGWTKGRALLANFLSALTFPIGALIAYALSSRINVYYLIPFAAGNFLYIGAVDLVPEFKARHDGTRSWLVVSIFCMAMAAMYISAL